MLGDLTIYSLISSSYIIISFNLLSVVAGVIPMSLETILDIQLRVRNSYYSMHSKYSVWNWQYATQVQNGIDINTNHRLVLLFLIVPSIVYLMFRTSAFMPGLYVVLLLCQNLVIPAYIMISGDANKRFNMRIKCLANYYYSSAARNFHGFKVCSSLWAPFSLYLVFFAVHSRGLWSAFRRSHKQPKVRWDGRILHPGMDFFFLKLRMVVLPKVYPISKTVSPCGNDRWRISGLCL